MKILLYVGCASYDLTTFGKEELIKRWKAKNMIVEIQLLEKHDFIFLQSVWYRTDEDLIEIVEQYGTGVLDCESDDYCITEITIPKDSSIAKSDIIIEECEAHGFDERAIIVMAEFEKEDNND